MSLCLSSTTENSNTHKYPVCVWVYSVFLCVPEGWYTQKYRNIDVNSSHKSLRTNVYCPLLLSTQPLLYTTAGPEMLCPHKSTCPLGCKWQLDGVFNFTLYHVQLDALSWQKHAWPITLNHAMFYTELVLVKLLTNTDVSGESSARNVIKTEKFRWIFICSSVLYLKHILYKDTHAHTHNMDTPSVHKEFN